MKQPITPIQNWYKMLIEPLKRKGSLGEVKFILRRDGSKYFICQLFGVRIGLGNILGAMV